MAVAAIAAFIAKGMTTEQAMIDYRSGKYVGGQYAFGISRIDEPYAQVGEPGDRESKLEWAKAHEDNHTGTHSEGGHASEKGNTAPTIVKRSVDNYSTAMAAGNAMTEIAGMKVNLRDLMRPYDPPHCANPDLSSHYVLNVRSVLPEGSESWAIYYTGLIPSLCRCDNIAYGAEAEKVMWRVIACSVNQCLNSIKRHPLQVEAFELYYLSGLSPTDAVAQAHANAYSPKRGTSIAALKKRAEWIVTRLRFRNSWVADYVCPWNQEREWDYDQWRKRMEQPHRERGPVH